MAVYTHLADEEIAAFLARDYAIGTLQSATGITEGVENSNYCLVVSAGVAAQKYILTLFERRVNQAELPFYLGLMQHLAARGFACPKPIPRRDRKLYGACAEKQAALVSFLQGKSREAISEADCFQVGKTLAALHQAGEGFTLTRSNSMGLQAWKMLQQKIAPGLDEISPGLNAFVEVEMQFLLQHFAAASAAVPQGVIHADLFPDNVFFEGEVLSGVIDFYFACNDALAYDLAIALNAWCFASEGGLDSAKVQQMLKGYESIRALSTAEKKAMPVLLRGAAMRFLLSRAHDWLHRDAGALVQVKDPMEYAVKLRFHQNNSVSGL